MQVPLEITFRDVPKTEAIEALVREKAAKLEQVCDYMISCRVAIERPHRHEETGNPYRVRIVMTVPPGKELVVTHDAGKGDLHHTVPTVVRSAFQAARRRLRKVVERQHGRVKVHPQQEAQALVMRLFREEGYGFLKTLDDREIYFHRNSVLDNDFDRLEVGTGVHFTEEEGEHGPQASTVQIVDKPGSRVRESAPSAAEPPLGWKPR